MSTLVGRTSEFVSETAHFNIINGAHHGQIQMFNKLLGDRETIGSVD